jgi:hypothetical protein
MSISSSAIASLVIAGTAIGGSTFAVMANSASTDINSPNMSQVTSETQTPGADTSAKIAGDSVANLDEFGNPTNFTPVNPSPIPTPTTDPTIPVVPPVDFGGNGDDDDDEGEYEDGNEDSYPGSYDDEGEEDDDDDYGHDRHHDDDDEEEDD